ncbi:hypothetical protein QZH41_014863, partial [Actinostola sp. cb2023]
ATIRIAALEDKIKPLEQLRTMESTDAALAAFRRHLSRPATIFDRYEAIELLQSLVRLARGEAHQKADEYAATLDEVRARADALDDRQLQQLMVGLLGDPIRARIAKEAASIIKNAGRAPASGSESPLTRRPATSSLPDPCCTDAATIRIAALEDKIKPLEQLRTMESTDAALAAFRRHLSRPATIFDRYEAIELLQSLVRLARGEAHQKADEYAATLDEVRARADALDDRQLQQLMVGLLGDPIGARIAKEAASIIKNAGRAPASGSESPLTRRPATSSLPDPCCTDA